MAARMSVLCWVWPPFPLSLEWELRAWSPQSWSQMNFRCPQNPSQQLHSWPPCQQAPHCSRSHCDSHHRWTRPPLEHCLAGHFHLTPQHYHWIPCHPSDQTHFCGPHHPVQYLTDCQVDRQSPRFHGCLHHSLSDDYMRSWSWTTPLSTGESLSKCTGCDLPVEEILWTLWILLNQLEKAHGMGCSYPWGHCLGCVQASSTARQRPRHQCPGDNPYPSWGPMSEGCRTLGSMPVALESHCRSRGSWE